MLIGALATIFLSITGRKETLFGDPSSHGRFSAFVQFLSAVWSAMPNSESPSLAQLNAWAWREREKSGAGVRQNAKKKVPLS